jgi:Ca2+-binding RTX toxin-like protein
MARLTASSIGFDMSSWDLSDIADGTVTYDSATKVDVDGSAFHYAILGTGLGDFDGSGFPQSGTVTGIDIEGPGHVATKITGISIDAATFMSYVDDNDTNGLESTIFAAKTSFIGGAGDDVLIGFGGNDKINVTEGGNDTVNGGAGNDTITFNAAFTAADQVDGGAGRDTVNLDGDYSAGVIFGADTMVNVELLKLGAGHTYNLTLNATTDTSGQSLEVYGYALGSANSLTLDGSAVAGSLRLLGGAGNDTLIGGAGANTINGEAGNDTIYAGTGTNTIGDSKGDNTFIFSNWNTDDTIKGGGDDTLMLNGDFSGGVTLQGSHISKVATLSFAAGHDYDISVNSTFATATIDGSALGAGDSLTFNGSDAATTVFKITGGAGNDVLTGNNAGDTFDLSYGGNDTVTGGTGNDTFDFGGAFTAADSVTGGGGNDILALNGDYSAGLTIGPDSMTGIYALEVTGNFNNSITTSDANVPAGQTLFVGLGSATISSAVTYTFNGSAETDGQFNIQVNGLATYHVTGGAGNDLIILDPRGDFNTADTFDGGGGYNTLEVTEADNIVFGSHTMTNIQQLDIGEYDVTMSDGNVAAGQTLAVNISGGFFDGLAETNGTFDVVGYLASDCRVYGGQGDDTIALDGSKNAFYGAGGADQLNCQPSSGDDLFYYKHVSDSTSTNYDVIANFDTSDKFSLTYSVNAVDTAVITGALSTATFDADLASAIGSSQLGVHDAVFFTPDSGSLAGDHFLVIDANGTAGYQAGQDYVIQITSNDFGDISLTASNFVT